MSKQSEFVVTFKITTYEDVVVLADDGNDARELAEPPTSCRTADNWDIVDAQEVYE